MPRGYGAGTYPVIYKKFVPRSPGQYPGLYLGHHKVQNRIPGQVPAIGRGEGRVTINSCISINIVTSFCDAEFIDLDSVVQFLVHGRMIINT